MRNNSGRPSRWWIGVLVGPVIAAGGCADFVKPTGHYAITHPWDTSTPISRGTSKAQVLEVWGKPDAVIPRGVDELGIPKEEWVYQGRADVPLDYRYLSKTKHILFSGDHVTGWTDEAAQDGPTHR